MRTSNHKNDEIKEVVMETYGVIANDFDGLLTLENSSKNEVEFFDTFLSYVTPGGIIADFGCGAGKHGRYCVKNGFKVIGYDFCKEMLDKARVFNAESNFKMELVEIEDMTNVKCECKFDAAIFMYSIIHLTKEQAEKALKNVNKYLKDGAYIAVSVYEGDRNDFYDEPLAPENYQYFCDYTESGLVDLIQSCGYEVVKRKSQEAQYDENESTNKCLEIYKWNDMDEKTGGNTKFGNGVIGIIARA